ncbi:HAD-IB family hydrolase [Prevotella sp. A2931]|uniref:HAD-IB family hydrolase n=1 Tax=Prevotella illustrans TaxID=2800387 RepID=A0ABS3M8P2_9BACT|nr:MULTISPECIES: HAD-IB family hydrolase [Prevotella]MBO1364480.1 HAD-IB family hydrolase [Prevotella illustrans]PTL27009.1 HAD-IB family hydrolase [Prevotella sp. oral taxon 820]
MRKIILSDFDGTLTTRDTLPAFIHYTCGSLRMAIGFLLFSPILVLMKFKLYPNWKAKQHLFNWFFGGMALNRFNALCTNFASKNSRLLRPEMVRLLKEARQEGAEIIIVSASIDNWVAPFFDHDIRIVGTQVETADGKLTGRFKTANCYGPEKVKRVKRLLGDEPRRELLITAYGDSRGDREMLAYADRAYLVKPNGDIRTIKNEEKDTPQDGGAVWKENKTYGEIVRFGIVGITATAIQYGVYLLSLSLLAHVLPSTADNMLATTANTIGYLVSFAFNFIASTRYTFQVEANAKREAGFALSHVVNYLLQTGFLNLFILLGLSKQTAMIPMFCLCVPINFLLVRFFLKR